MSDREQLEKNGFEGFVSVKDLRATLLREVPDSAGVYVFLRENEGWPTFLVRNAGGHFKRKDPTVPEGKLKDAWIHGTAILYIGKAGGTTGSSTLRKRLTQYLKFGSGKVVGHWGGRYI